MPANPIDQRKSCDDSAAAAVQPLPALVSAGARVRVRGASWRVDAVVPHADCRELHLSDSGAGRRVLLWPFDRPVAIDDRPRFASVTLGAWCAGLNRHLARDAEPWTPRARTIRADVLPYQLEPAIAVAKGASRVLLADEVGLGKTIQAGWIVADLMARERDVRVLIAVPAGLRTQWATELASSFDIACEMVDARWLRRRAADVPADIAPWAAPGVYLGSLDFLKRTDVALSLASQVWDLLVVDEAHTATSPTERYAALAAVASRSRRVVVITATPYSGDPAGFTSMLSLGAAPDGERPLMFRRSRADAGDTRRRRHRFATIRISRAETRLQRLLEAYSRDVWREAPDGGDGARLAVTILRKRALSSPGAVLRSLKRRRDLLESTDVVPRQLALFDVDVADEVPDAVLGTPGLADAAGESRRLDALIAAAEGAAPADSKRRFLARLLRRLGHAGTARPARPAEPVILFTEYRDTLFDLASALPPALHLHGGLSAAERSDVQTRFNAEGGLLLATDAAAEGLNLQHRCRLVVNYELPWNPARLEQRIGRVDRIGQRRTVHAVTLVARDTAEDLVIANLARRLARVAATLGEADRLGAFLTDARAARLVIAGEEPPDRPQTLLPPDLFVAAERVPEADDAAVFIRHSRHSHPPASEILVSVIRSSHRLPPGVVVCASCRAVTSDDGDVAVRIVIVHVPLVTGRPSHAEARRLAARAAGVVQHLPALVPNLEPWFARARGSHEAAIDRRLAREAALCDRSTSPSEVQQGLFDGRALREADERSLVERANRADHQRRIDALLRARPLRLTCAAVAVLVSWR